jgi:hypothetical protein
LAGIAVALQIVVAGRALLAAGLVLTTTRRHAGTAVATAALTFVALPVDAALLTHVAAIALVGLLVDEHALGTPTVVLATQALVTRAVATRLPGTAALEADLAGAHSAVRTASVFAAVLTGSAAFTAHARIVA